MNGVVNSPAPEDGGIVDSDLGEAVGLARA